MCGKFIIRDTDVTYIRDTFGENSMKNSFREIWLRILKNEGEEFKTKRGLPFIYKINGNQVIPNRTDYPLHKSEFKKAYDLMPTSGPAELSDIIRGPSYVWAILNDSRIR